MRIKVEIGRDDRRDEEVPDLVERGECLRLEVRRDRTCYVMEGEVKVTTPEGEAVEFGPGDLVTLVTFPRGLVADRVKTLVLMGGVPIKKQSAC